MNPFTSDEEVNSVLTAAYLPVGVDSGEIVNYINKVHHIQISAGLVVLKPKIFHIVYL